MKKIVVFGKPGGGKSSLSKKLSAATGLKLFPLDLLEYKKNGAPGYRDYWPGYYAAFIYDPDGHNIEAVWYNYNKADNSL